ncbi:MAG TPA: phosphotransferase, partial [Ktedonobacterales bacterium]|nr:phosphotransferase [Ktedonobacterales bacterium]
MSLWSRPLHFSSPDEMLAPETLARFAGFAAKPPMIASRETITGGFSGATIERIIVRDDTSQQSFIVKRIDPDHDWLMLASGDTLCREVQFTRSTLSAQLPPDIVLPVLATAYADHAGALLMSDVARMIIPATRCYEAVDDALVARVIDHLAALHARYWEDPTLTQYEWLSTPSNALFALTPVRLQFLLTKKLSREDMYGIDALKRWFHLWQYLDPADAGTIQHMLAHPARLLQSLQTAPATLVHGDAWLANMGEDQGRLILLDWALATTGPATFDSLWFAHTWHGLDAEHVLVMHRDALLQHGINAVANDETWALLTDLGSIRTTLMGIEWLVREVMTSSNIYDR